MVTCRGEGMLPRSMGDTAGDPVTGLCPWCKTFQPMTEVVPPSKPEWPREFRMAAHEEGEPESW